MRYTSCFDESLINSTKRMQTGLLSLFSTFFLAAVFLLGTADSLMAQNEQARLRLAQQYFTNADYQKAAALYKDLYEMRPENTHYFDQYYQSLIRLRNYDEAEKIVRAEIRKNSQRPELYVFLGSLYELNAESARAEAQFRKAIEVLPADINSVNRLASSFMQLTKYELAAEAYEKGISMLGNNQAFTFNLAELYRRSGDQKMMIHYYLSSVADQPGRVNTIQTLIQRYLDKDMYDELITQLYTRIQESPDIIQFPEFLIWVLEQRSDYRGAIRQARAIDRRLDENGIRVYQLAQRAYREGLYRDAIDGFSYIVEAKGPGTPLYIEARRELLRSRRAQIVEGFSYEREDLMVLRTEYDAFLADVGKNRATAQVLAQYAELEALYLDSLPKAIALLNELISIRGADRLVVAMAKIDLGDYYLMAGDIWEATLLYSQVDKEFKEDAVGQEARYRNARLSYFTGDFEWAQAQFDVLKSATSRLIANDAIDMSVFIMDNLGLDTTPRPLQMFAEAELLAFRNRFDEAIAVFDRINREYPKHQLEAHIYYSKAGIYMRLQDYNMAGSKLQRIVDHFPRNIRADNALFKLAGLYEHPEQLNDPEKAMELYSKLMIEYSDSVFSVQSRQRFRALRGDLVP